MNVRCLPLVLAVALGACTGSSSPPAPPTVTHTDLAAFVQEACSRRQHVTLSQDSDLPLLPDPSGMPPSLRVDVALTPDSALIDGTPFEPNELDLALDQAVRAVREASPGQPVHATLMAESQVSTSEVRTVARRLLAHADGVWLVGRIDPGPLPVAPADKANFEQTREQLERQGTTVQPAQARQPILQSIQDCPELVAFVDREGADVCAEISALQQAQQGCEQDLGAVAAWYAPPQVSGMITIGFQRIQSAPEGKGTWGQDIR